MQIATNKNDPQQKSEGNVTLLRPVPDVFKTPDLFDLCSDFAVGKDQVSLMDVAPFSLSKKNTGRTRLEITLKNKKIEVTCNHHGMMTINDYDFILFLYGNLVRQMEENKRGIGTPPVNRFRVNVADFLRFAKRQPSAGNYARIEGMLDRLFGTTLKFTVDLADGSKHAITTSWLTHIQTEGSTATGNISVVDVQLSPVFFDAFLKAEQANYLTVNQDYFLLKSGLAKFLYRLARKAAGKSNAFYNLENIYKRSGSSQDFKYFKRDLKEIIGGRDFPDYEFLLVEGVSDDVLLIRHKDASWPAGF